MLHYMNDEKCFFYRASTLKGRANGELCSTVLTFWWGTRILGTKLSQCRTSPRGSQLFVGDENPGNEVESVAFSLTFPP